MLRVCFFILSVYSGKKAQFHLPTLYESSMTFKESGVLMKGFRTTREKKRDEGEGGMRVEMGGMVGGGRMSGRSTWP